MMNLTKIAQNLGKTEAPATLTLRQRVLRVTGDSSCDPTRVSKTQEALLGNASAFNFFRMLALGVVSDDEYRKHKNAAGIMLHSRTDLLENCGPRYPAYVEALLTTVDASYCKGSHTRAYSIKPEVLAYLLSTKAALRQYKANQSVLYTRPEAGTKREVYSLSNLLSACEDKALSPRTRQSAVQLLSLCSLDEETNEAIHDVKYSTTNSRDLGRTYTSTISIQTMSKELRKLILVGYASVDIKNSLPSILNSITKGKHPTLNHYCGQDREAIIKEIGNEFGADRKAVKGIILAVVHGASVKRKAANGEDTAFADFLKTCTNEAAIKAAKRGSRASGSALDFLDQLSADMRAAAREVANSSDEYATLWNDCQARAREAHPNAAGWRLEGSVIGIFLQTIERAYVDKLEQKLTALGLIVSARVHDEVYVLFKAGTSAKTMTDILAPIIAQVSAELAVETGISLDFTISTYV
jgi:hypothetical protein